ncbi:hypothetical protein NMY22_g1624 [Coprinellus aureogranulatus]|nr:hypothetical protein NMY22_g1624 [Coprinellus aureogranulatus]
MPLIALTTANMPSPLFHQFTMNEIIDALAFDGNLHVVNGQIMWNQPASSANAVAQGLIQGVPGHWSMGDLMMKLMFARLGSAEVEICVSKVAVYRAHEATAHARAAQASAEALKQEAYDLESGFDAVEQGRECEVVDCEWDIDRTGGDRSWG